MAISPIILIAEISSISKSEKRTANSPLMVEYAMYPSTKSLRSDFNSSISFSLENILLNPLMGLIFENFG